MLFQLCFYLTSHDLVLLGTNGSPGVSVPHAFFDLPTVKPEAMNTTFKQFVSSERDCELLSRDYLISNANKALGSRENLAVYSNPIIKHGLQA